MSTTSEKIYFLKLATYERRDYLVTKGIIQENRAPANVTEKMFGVRKQGVALGMKKEDVLSSLGRPMRVEVAGNPHNENERWLYRINGNQKYIYFESGHVEGWE